MVKENNLNEELFDHCQKELTVLVNFWEQSRKKSKL
jgi:hypothetical protein